MAIISLCLDRRSQMSGAFRSFLMVLIGSIVGVCRADDIEELAKKLSSVDLSERRDAAYAFAAIGPAAVEALDELAGALGDKDTQVWFQSITTLGKLGPDAASIADQVAIHLGSDSEQRRFRAAWCLSRFGEAAIPAVSRSMKEGSLKERVAAINAFGSMMTCRDQVVPLLRSALSDEDSSVAQEAIGSLSKLQATSELVAALSDTRSEIRIGAANALSRVDQIPESANSILIEMSRESNLQARSAAISAMGSTNLAPKDLQEAIRFNINTSDPMITNSIIVLLKKRSRVPGLVSAVGLGLTSNSAKIRASSARVLLAAAKGTEEAFQALIKALEISTTDSSDVSHAISRMGPGVINQLLQYQSKTIEMEQKILQTLYLFDQSISDQLLVAVSSDDSKASVRATKVLAAMEPVPKKAITQFVKALDSSDENLQVASLGGLGKSSELPDEALQKIRDLASGEQVSLRVAAIVALASVDPSSDSSLQIFDRACLEEDVEIRVAILQAIALMDGTMTRYQEFLERSLQDEVVNIRSLAVFALGRMEVCPQRYESHLVELLDDEIFEIRLSALRALAVLEKKKAGVAARIAQILSTTEEKTQLQVLEVLADYGTSAREQVDAVTQLLKHQSSTIRSAAINCLAKINRDEETLLGMFIPMLDDTDWTVRREAAKQIGEFGSKARIAVPRLFVMLESEEDEEAARSALRSIDDAGPEALEVLLKGLDSKDPRVRFYAMFLIGKIGPPAKEAVPKLEKMLDDSESSRFRETIQQAITRIQSE